MRKLLKLSALYVRMSIGTGIKTLGYLLVAAGIFMGLVNKTLGLQLIYLGVSFVAVGWLIIVRTLNMAKKLNIPKLRIGWEKRTRIIASFRGDYVLCEDDDAVICGRVQKYDKEKRMWVPAKGKLRILLDNTFLKDITVDNEFEVKFSATKGKHILELRFVPSDLFESSYKTLKFQVVSRDEKLKIGRTIKVAYCLFFLLVLVPLFLFAYFKLKI